MNSRLKIDSSTDKDKAYENAIKYIINRLKSIDISTVKAERASKVGDIINKIKIEAARRYKLKKIPSNIDIIKYLPKNDYLINILRLKPVRSISGVVIIAIMSAPYECPHGRCLYCPHYPKAPVSYTGKEPSARRGILNLFDPYMQIRRRMKQLEDMGHFTDKIEIIIQGGTFNRAPKYYREWFMRRLLQAFIGYYPRDYNKGLRDAERSEKRIVGITFETRPDACDYNDVDWMLEHGGTRVEIGVQTIFDDVYKYVNRGHLVRDVIEATRKLKDAGFKVTYHIMPGLPKGNRRLDLEIFNTIFSSPNYMPDNLKIYPTLVLKYTGLIEYWRKGLYKPYSTNDSALLIELVKGNIIPKWVRIMRVNRDIPTMEIVDGIDKPNLRQVVLLEMNLKGLRCRCIRCREVGHRVIKRGYELKSEIVINVVRYEASEGLEYFITAEDPESDVIFGFLRLRKPSHKAWRPEIVNSETYIVRELHVYGQSIPIGECEPWKWGSWQHRGIGSALLKNAEELVSSLGGDKIVIISGVGVREYYYRRGYMLDGPYVSKKIK